MKTIVYVGLLLVGITLIAQEPNKEVLRYTVIDNNGLRRSTTDGGKTWSSEAKETQRGNGTIVLQENKQHLLLPVYMLAGWLELQSNERDVLRLYALPTGREVYNSSYNHPAETAVLPVGVYILQRIHQGQQRLLLLCLTE